MLLASVVAVAAAAVVGLGGFDPRQLLLDCCLAVERLLCWLRWLRLGFCQGGLLSLLSGDGNLLCLDCQRPGFSLVLGCLSGFGFS